MPDTPSYFYVRKIDAQGQERFIKAKFLVVNGQPVIDPNRDSNNQYNKSRTYTLYKERDTRIGIVVNSNGYLIVPFDFQLKTYIHYADDLRERLNNSYSAGDGTRGDITALR
jgi:hypothetical protein